MLPTILEDRSPAESQPSVSAMRPPLGVLSNIRPFYGGRFRRKRALSAVPSPHAEAGDLPAASQGTEVTVVQRNARLAWARRMTQAPMRAVRAARTTYVPLGQQVWLRSIKVVLFDRMYVLRREKSDPHEAQNFQLSALLNDQTTEHPSI